MLTALLRLIDRIGDHRVSEHLRGLYFIFIKGEEVEGEAEHNRKESRVVELILLFDHLLTFLLVLQRVSYIH